MKSCLVKIPQFSKQIKNFHVCKATQQKKNNHRHFDAKHLCAQLKQLTNYDKNALEHKKKTAATSLQQQQHSPQHKKKLN
jgi:hypothetical protein